MHQRGVPRLWVRVEPHTQTRMGMRKDLKHSSCADLKVVLKHRFKNITFDIVLPCWDMGGKEGKKWSRHCGEHTGITISCCSSREFSDIMRKCYDGIARKSQMGKHTIRVVCLCSQGRHRSVAVASTLAAVYAKMGYNSLMPKHLSKSRWWEGMCSKCTDCKPNKKKDKLYEQLARDYAPAG